MDQTVDDVTFDWPQWDSIILLAGLDCMSPTCMWICNDICMHDTQTHKNPSPIKVKNWKNRLPSKSHNVLQKFIRKRTQSLKKKSILALRKIASVYDILSIMSRPQSSCQRHACALTLMRLSILLSFLGFTKETACASVPCAVFPLTLIHLIVISVSCECAFQQRGNRVNSALLRNIG